MKEDLKKYRAQLERKDQALKELKMEMERQQEDYSVNISKEAEGISQLEKVTNELINRRDAEIEALRSELDEVRRDFMENLKSKEAEWKLQLEAMRSVMDVRKQLRQQTQSLQSTSQTDASTYQTISESPTPREVLGENIIKSFLLGFKTNIAILCPDKSYKTAFSRQTVSIHLSSVLADRDRNKKMEGIVFCDFVFTQKAYARNVSAIQLQWLDEL